MSEDTDRIVVEIVKGVTSTIMAFTPAGLFAPLLGPAFEVAYQLDQRANEQRAEGAARAVLQAADDVGVQPEQLAALIGDDPDRLRLAQRVIRAAADPNKTAGTIRALGSVLAIGILDEARLDESFLLVSCQAEASAIC